MSHMLNYRLTLYEPVGSSRGATGQRERPTYRAHYTHAKIMSAGGVDSQEIGLVIPADVRRYVIRWREDITSAWYFKDDAGNFFRVEGLAPTLGGRRKGFLVISGRAVGNPNLTLEAE